MDTIVLLILAGAVIYLFIKDKKKNKAVPNDQLTEDEMSDMTVEQLVEYANKRWGLELPVTISRHTLLLIIRQRHV